jgi:tetratricopeptide (TPR) repeat protein
VVNEWYGLGDPMLGAVALITEDMIQAGALNLAAAALDALAASDATLTPLDWGRLTARRARVDWMLSNNAEALAAYRRLEAFGRQARSPEITVRALIGRVALAQMKGNYPEMERNARRALRLARRAGLARLARHARNGLMIVASARERYGEAVLHGWEVYQASAGSRIDEAEILQNLGQVLALAGHAAAARAAFALIVSRKLPPRILLPALGCCEPQLDETVWKA